VQRLATIHIGGQSQTPRRTDERSSKLCAEKTDVPVRD
jgi:hypothetical protein